MGLPAITKIATKNAKLCRINKQQRRPDWGPAIVKRSVKRKGRSVRAETYLPRAAVGYIGKSDEGQGEVKHICKGCQSCHTKAQRRQIERKKTVLKTTKYSDSHGELCPKNDKTLRLL